MMVLPFVGRWAAGGLLLALLLSAFPTHAQEDTSRLPQGLRPSQRLGPLPTLERLPPLELALPELRAPAASPDLSTSLRLYVADFRFEGNKVISSGELARVVEPWTRREVTSDELEAARRALTMHYIERGYINSGAVLPDQAPTGGIITFKIVEGTLNEIEVHGNRWLNRSYYTRRILRLSGTPLNIHGTQEALFRLNESPLVQKVNADLQPGGLPGESRLKLLVKERSPFRLGVEFSNDRPTSVGAEHLDLIASDLSVTGRGDAFDLRFTLLQKTENGADFPGLRNIDLAYSLPLSSWDTMLRVYYSHRDYAVIEEPFTELGLDSESEVYGIALRQPLYRTSQKELALTIQGERRHGETSLGGTPFSLSPGAVDGESDIAVLALIPEWTWRTQQEVFAVRFSFNVGLDALGATKGGTSRDGRFFAIIGQGQYVRRLGSKGAQLILRSAFQWTDDPLLSLEQFPVGGAETVRGYRENQLVRDKGVQGSVELRVPVWSRGNGSPLVQLAAFYDIGAAWNVDEKTPDPTTISSAGAGLILTPSELLTAQIYWGYAFTDIPIADKQGLQDYGFNFRITLRAF